MTSPFQVYLSVLSVIAIIIVPVSFYFTWQAWVFVRRYKGFKLPIVVAVVNTITAPIAAYIGWLAWHILLDGDPPDFTRAISPLVFVILDIVPLITTGYLIWLSGRKKDDDRRERLGEDRRPYKNEP